jgi:hypothetical protein
MPVASRPVTACSMPRMDAVLIFVPLLLLVVLWYLSELVRQDRRKTRRLIVIERKLQLVMDHLGVVEPPPDMPEVLRHLDDGRKIPAIKAYRDATGADLKQAKDAVEDLARQRGLS